MAGLSDAIVAVEQAQAGLVSADAARDLAQTKYDAAASAKSTADSSDSDAVAAFNGALDSLIAAATDAKVDRTAPAPDPAPVPLTATATARRSVGNQ